MTTFELPAAVHQLDNRIDAAWETIRGNPTVDRIFYSASEMGDFGLIWMAAAGVHALSGSPLQGRALVRMAGALAVESVVVNQGIKRLFRRQRPTFDGARPHGLRSPSTSSFPSGHSTSAVTAAILISQTSPIPAPMWWGVAALVASSRVHVKIHHASDVAGGMLIGVGIGTLIRHLVPIH